VNGFLRKILLGRMMEERDKKSIKSFRDLDVYQNAYEAMLIVFKEILPNLPDTEKFDLHSQLLRSSKAIPRLIAEGYAKKHQKAGFRKYIDDAHAESNEIIVCVEQSKDLYDVNETICNDLIDRYDKISRQLFKLAQAWHQFSRKEENE